MASSNSVPQTESELNTQPKSLFDVAVELDTLRFLLDGDAYITTQEAADELRKIITHLEDIIGGWQRPAEGYRRDGLYMADINIPVSDHQWQVWYKPNDPAEEQGPDYQGEIPF